MRFLRWVREMSGRELVLWGVLLGLIILHLASPFIERVVFRWHFKDRCYAYEQAYREKNMTCYRMSDWNPEIAWLVTLGATDYEKELYVLSDDPDPDVNYWASRTLVTRYPRSPLATRLVYQWVDSPATPADRRLSGALILADWNDRNRIERQCDIFRSSTDDIERHWLGLYLASLGIDEGLRYALARFSSSKKHGRNEIARRLTQCLESHPDAIHRYSSDADADVRKGWSEFDAWRKEISDASQ